MVQYVTGLRPRINRRAVIALTTLARVGMLRKRIDGLIQSGQYDSKTVFTESVSTTWRLPPALVVYAYLVREPEPRVMYWIVIPSADRALHRLLLAMFRASRRTVELTAAEPMLIVFQLRLSAVSAALLELQQGGEDGCE